MNQILITEKKKNNSMNGTAEIKAIIRFFAVAILLFGIILSSEGVYAIYRDIDDRKPENIPSVTIGRVNDKAIIHVEHKVEISKITYSWDNGEKTVIPVGGLTTQEEIMLLGYDSVLNLNIEDINGKQVTYKKQYILNNVDITKPTIDIETTDGNDKMIITANDETSLLYVSYKWEGEEEVIIDAQTENQTEIKEEITLTPGTRKIKIIAEDMNGNVEQIEKEILASTSKPEMMIMHNGKEIIVQVNDKDGVKDIVINLNGKRYSAKDLNIKEVQIGPLQLQEGNNTISIEVTNVSGYTQSGTTELQYTP